MDPATIRFRLALPYALFPASPPLAALHAHRVRALHPDNLPPGCPACSRCGSLLIERRRPLNKNKKHKRVLRRSCRICGAVNDLPLPTATSHGTIQPPPPPPPVSEPVPAVEPGPSAAPAKPRPKKKSGLQHLLARNRENEERERHKQKQSSSQLGGLAAFLGGLS